MAGFRTSWDTLEHPRFDLWTTANASEITPGIVCPFTAQLLNRNDGPGMRRLIETYPSLEGVQIADPPAANLIGVFGGRIALNSGFTVAAASGLDPDLGRAMLRLYVADDVPVERFIVEASAEAVAASSDAAERERDEADVALRNRIEDLVAERRSDAAERILSLDPPAAWKRLVEMTAQATTEDLRRHWIMVIAANEHLIRLGELLASAGLDETLAIQLTSGLGDLESSGPAVELHRLATLVADHAELTSAFREESIGAVLRLIANPGDEPSRRFSTAFTEFIVRWGYRCQGEIDPTNPDWEEQPGIPVSQIRSMLDVDDERAPAACIAAAVERREALEQELRAQLADELRDAFDEAVAASQHFTRLRDLSKVAWAMAARRARAPYLALARGLVREGLLEREDDLRFCFLSEVERLVEGTVPIGLPDRLAHRRSQADEAAQHTLPSHWIGQPDIERLTEPVDDDEHLQGIGVSAGDGPVSGPARVVTSTELGLARALEDGAVLVAPFTDAPWTPLFIPAGAVVVERGGMHSRAATVAREFGVPCVVMVDEATRRITDGEMVTVDGATGEITIDG
ncbi:MAG: PEP-utilizing enzyme [Actinomycetota bacterium]